MKRREFIALLGWGCAAPFGAQAQQTTKLPYRVGVLSPEVPPPGLIEAFEEGLRDLGYIRGQNLTIDLRIAEGDNQRLAAHSDDLVKLPVDVILAVNTLHS